MKRFVAAGGALAATLGAILWFLLLMSTAADTAIFTRHYPLLIGLNLVYQRRADLHYNTAQDELGKLSSAVHESFDGVTVVKALGAESRGTRDGSPLAVVADVEEWQSRFGLLSSLRASHHVLLDGCSPADYRAVTRSRGLPPPLPTTPGACWLLDADGQPARALLPSAG